ncbi:putative Zinc-ribbon domain [Trypanosoma melophagium]|uniref:putative Zinc-ribbon domain n=1 Tax=Trypanosoma melophagium TaxID=715481 RepID=UPI00351A0CC3|nr:putative Zinc-ribbon domain [Trypanosoma melophagium]
MQSNRPILSPIFTVTLSLLARSTPIRSLTVRPDSLATFHPALARTWLTAASNKLLQPQHVLPTSRKLAWWRCSHCNHEHHKRIDLHVAAGGACPKCKHMPTLQNNCNGNNDGISSSGRDSTDNKTNNKIKHKNNNNNKRENVEMIVHHVKHRCRPDNSRSVLAADNANRVKSSIADGGYLRVVETRNLQPMLARNYTNEAEKIAENELLFVSPKLDGVRCIVAWNAEKKGLCFFSRSGTLFECCDHRIEPALRPLFEKDPTLVLDGELYNHNVDDFEQLISAIRTTRERRTPAIEELQAKLQYHAFDIMYAKKFSDMSSVPYSKRYAYLQGIIAKLTSSPSEENGSKAVVLVPAIEVEKSRMQRVLQLSLADGYEGIIIRRDGPTISTTTNTLTNTLTTTTTTTTTSNKNNKKKTKNNNNTSSSNNSRSAVIGYAYGSRSPNLLKYKVMQDDEYVIVSGVEGRGKWKGCLGAFVCRTKGGHHFTVAPATTEENKRDMWHRLKAYKGKVLTVQYQELSANGVPRFPIGKCVRGAKGGRDWI